MRIKNIIIVDVDSDREDNILIGHPDDQQPVNHATQIIDDMACLCEAICTLIHLAEQNGIKKSAASLRDCIKHLQDGFADASYKTRIEE